MKYRLPLLLFCTFMTMTVVYAYVQFEENDIYKTFLSVSTFLFAIFAGFFISRQSARYNEIRNLVSEFDGEVSNIYRFSRRFGKRIQKKFEVIILAEYKKIIKYSDWDLVFVEKTNFIASLLEAMDVFQKKNPNAIESAAITRVNVSTASMQRIRKRAISLGNEHIPPMQWFLIVFLVVMILLLIATMQFEILAFAIFLKALFSTIIILVIYMLWQFDRLHFFEATVGSSSAQDVIDIIKGRK